MKTIDLSDLKAGDKAWSMQYGVVDVFEIKATIIIKEIGSFDFSGKWMDFDPHPTLFHSEQEFREYWGIESNTLTKREQFAMAAMQGLVCSSTGYEQTLVCSSTGYEQTSELAVKHADALLTKLNEKP
jgi:hypothetical protein